MWLIMKNMNYRGIKSPVLAFFSAFLAFLALIQITVSLTSHLQTGLIDFNIYHHYGQILLSGRSPYGPEYTEGIPFNYPPSSFILFAPLALLPLKSATMIFTAFSLLFFIITGNIFLKNFFPSKITRCILLVLLLQNFPVKFTLVTGQVNLIVISLLLMAFVYDQKNSPAAAGLFWGLAAAVKLTPLTLILYFLLRKRCLSVLTGALLILFSNLFFVAIQPQNIYYFGTHLPSLLEKSGFVTSFYDQSLRAFISRLGLESDVFLSNTIIILLFVLVIWNFWTRRAPLRNLIFFSQILLITTIGNSFAWQHHFVLTFPAFITASYLSLRKNSWLYFSLIFISAVLIGSHIPDISHPPTTNPFFVSHTLMGTIILLLILLNTGKFKAKSK